MASMFFLWALGVRPRHTLRGTLSLTRTAQPTLASSIKTRGFRRIPTLATGRSWMPRVLWAQRDERAHRVRRAQREPLGRPGLRVLKARWDLRDQWDPRARQGDKGWLGVRDLGAPQAARGRRGAGGAPAAPRS